MEFRANDERYKRAHLLMILNQVEVGSFYLSFPIVLNKMVNSPLREDKTPSCKFINEEGNLVMFDFTRGKSYALFPLLMEFFSCSYEELRDKIVNDFFVGKRTSTINRNTPNLKVVSYKERNTELKIVPREILESDLALWNISDLVPITKELLITYRIIPISFYVYADKVFQTLDPAYAFSLSKEYTQIYRPKLSKSKAGSEGRYRANTTRGIYGLDKCLKNHSYILITKSFRDWFYLSALGFNVCFVLSEAHKFTEEELDLLKQYSERIVLLYDNDKTGIEKAGEAAEKHSFEAIFYKEAKDSVEMLQKNLNLTVILNEMLFD